MIFENGIIKKKRNFKMDMPPAIIEFATQNNIENVQKDEIFYIKKEIFGYKNIDEAYCGISNQAPQFKKQKDRIYTECSYILIENGKIRLATPEESEQLNQVLCL